MEQERRDQMCFVVFDLEATCWENEKRQNEIIEIGAVKLDHDLEVREEFCQFVRPVIHPRLSEFCTKLTSIDQMTVDQADIFQVVIEHFSKFVGELPLVSWGQYDKNQILREATAKGYTGPILGQLDRHYNLKNIFADQRKTKRCGVHGALTAMGFVFQGTPHRGVDDARNIARIAKAMAWKPNGVI